MKKKVSRRLNKKAGVLSFILIVVLVCLVAYFGYLIYSNIPGDPEKGRISFESITNGDVNKDMNLSAVKQFYPNMKFNHKQISYSIDANCPVERKRRVLMAFDELSIQVNALSFYEISNSPDIEVSCSEENKPSINEDYFVAGEGGAKEIIQTGKFNVISEGIILLYDDKKGLNCNYPNIELHELMHVFGFDHSEERGSLMYSYLESCEQVLDSSIIEQLEELYSFENLPDLYFSEVQAVKKGKYLDFNLSIKNAGVKNVSSVNFSIFDEGEFVDSKKLGEIKYGAGIFIEITNFKLINRASKEVRFVIDRLDLIEELDEENNVAKVEFE